MQTLIIKKKIKKTLKNIAKLTNTEKIINIIH